MSKATQKLDSGIDLNRRDLSAVVSSGEDDDDELEVLGRAMNYQIGSVTVPHDWLVQKCDEFGVPSRLVPSETRPSSAYKRAMSRMLTPERETQSNVAGLGKDVELELYDGSGNSHKLKARVFFEEDEVGVDGGQWEHHPVGTFSYDSNTQDIRCSQSGDCPPALTDVWEEATTWARDEFDHMLDHHNGTDIRNIAYYLRLYETDSVLPLNDNGGLYFVPEGPLTDTVESIQDLYSAIDENWREDGSPVSIRLIEIIDNQNRREWVQNRVEKSLEKMVDDVVEEAFDMLTDDNDESTASEIVREVMDELDAAVETADQYNSLLQAEFKVEELLEEHAESVGKDKEELVEQVMAQSQIDNF